MRFFRYLQMRSYVHSVPRYKMKAEFSFPEDLLIKSISVCKKTLSYLYGENVKWEKIDTNISRCSCKSDFGTTISKEIWETVLLNVKEISC